MWKKHFAFQESSIHFFPQHLTFDSQAFQISHKGKLAGKEMWEKISKSQVYLVR